MLDDPTRCSLLVYRVPTGHCLNIFDRTRTPSRKFTLLIKSGCQLIAFVRQVLDFRPSARPLDPLIRIQFELVLRKAGDPITHVKMLRLARVGWKFYLKTLADDSRYAITGFDQVLS